MHVLIQLLKQMYHKNINVSYSCIDSIIIINVSQKYKFILCMY